MKNARVAVVGGGIVGAAVTRRLLEVAPDRPVTLFEKEQSLAAHQSGHNSGVVHAGLYYTPGSLKARLCRRGGELLREFCAEHDLPVRRCGKVLVALDETELARLDDIQARALANGVADVRRLGPDGLGEIEPHVRGVGGLHSPSTSIVDYRAVTEALAADAVRRGATIRCGTPVTGLTEGVGETLLRTEQETLAFDRVIVCAGLQADRLAVLAGDDEDPRIVPFRGEYLLLRPTSRHLVRGLVYPVPDPRYPFLGVHLTPRIDGEVMVGPNAVLATSREGYRRRDVSARDLREAVLWPGFARFAGRHWRTGVREVLGSASRRRFVAAAKRYVPELTVGDLVTGPTGVRAQALGRDGALVDDFRIGRVGRVVTLRNAPSPAATSSMAIAEHLVSLVEAER